MPKMMLVCPHRPGRRGEESINVIVQMPLNLAYLVTLTPDDWEIDLIDENYDSALNADETETTFEGFDLVGVTGYTYHADRAYKIAQACRKKGMTTIMGGIHASVMPEEAQRYFDAVVVGEVEAIWGRILDDFQHGRLQKQYNGGNPDLAVLKGLYPDREFMKKKYGYKYSSIITTRGCPFSCEFCSVPTFQGKFRQRDPEDVIAELVATDYKGLMLAEDNFYGHGPRANARARKLFSTMVARGIWKDWFGFSSLKTAEDDEMLAAMAQSGCFGMLIGIESTNPAALDKMNKVVNVKQIGVENYSRAIKKMHDHGLILWGSVIFGGDGEDPDCFKRMADFVMETSMDILSFGISTPLPKTPLFWRIYKQGRNFRLNFPHDWQYYDTANLTYRLADMSLEQFIEGMQYLYDNIYTTERLRERFRITRAATGNLRNSLFAMRVSLDWQKVFEQVLEDLKKLYDSGDYYQPARQDLDHMLNFKLPAVFAKKYAELQLT